MSQSRSTSPPNAALPHASLKSALKADFDDLLSFFDENNVAIASVPTFAAFCERWCSVHFDVIHCAVIDAKVRGSFMEWCYGVCIAAAAAPAADSPMNVGRRAAALYALWMLFATQPSSLGAIPIPVSVTWWREAVQFARHDCAQLRNANDPFACLAAMAQSRAIVFVAHDEGSVGALNTQTHAMPMAADRAVADAERLLFAELPTLFASQTDAVERLVTQADAEDDAFVEELRSTLEQ